MLLLSSSIVYCCTADALPSSRYPLPIGQEGSGVVVAVGSQVTTLRAGDEVYGISVEKPMFRGPPPALASQYALVKENLLLPKPAHLSFEGAASLSATVTTAYQTIRRGLRRRGESSLEGRTVFVPAGLSSTGSVMIQVAKKVFGAARIITTVSTPKVGLVEEYLPGLVDQVVDYKTQRVEDEVPRGSVDYMLNTQWGSLAGGIPLLNPKTGVLMSIASVPSRETVREMVGGDRFPWWLGVALGLAQLYYKWKLRGTSIEYEMVSGSPDVREDLERAGEIVALGQVRPVVRVVDLEDLEAVRKGCGEVFTSKGGLGKLVVRIP